MAGLPPRRWLVRGTLLGVVVVLVALSGVVTLSYDEPTLRAGVTNTTPESETVISSQGWHTQGVSLPGRPAQIVGVNQTGAVDWTYNGSENTTNWFYDVDPLPNGNFLVVNPVRDATVVYEFDPETRERVWTERLASPDIHDVDLINGDELLVAGINYDTGAVSNDSVFVYNLTADRVTWRWEFKNHYPANTGNGIDAKDWTHVNDADEFADGEFLVSVRNMDQVIAINRSTKAIDLRLGEDDNHSILYEQHNPTYLESENGTPTILVADSENDRIVEYERTGGPAGNGTWERTWELTGFDWPRDADRLPNGNTLITDSLNQRVVEVTPRGEVVWEYFAPWAPYDAERLSTAQTNTTENASVGGSNGPTIADVGASGNYTLTGATNASGSSLTFSTWVAAAAVGTPVASEVDSLARGYAHVTPFIRPVWLSSWGFAAALGALLLALCWVLGEAVYGRGRIRRGVARRLP